MTVAVSNATSTILSNRLTQHRLCPFTPRQREIVQMLADGVTFEQTADRLFLGKRTVKEHLDNARELVGAHSRIQLMAIAFREGWVS